MLFFEVILLMAEFLHQLRLVVYPLILQGLYIPGGAGFLNHQQYVSLVIQLDGEKVFEEDISWSS